MSLARPQRKRTTTVPTDSLSDVAFLLIIFFILTTSIRRLTGFTSEMPAAQRAASEQTVKTPTVGLRTGGLTFNDQPIDLAQLRQRLMDLNLAVKKDNDRIVVVEGSGNVSYQQYFEVMSAISSAGGVVGMVTEETEGKP